MNKKLTFAAALLAASVLGGVANAKTLVYCAEASPEGFDPAPYTAGQTFDASSRTVFNRLVEFDHGKTTTSPGLAESWTISDDGKEYVFKLRKGVKFAATDYFTPTRDFNADDVVFSFERQVDKNGPWFQYIPGIAYQYYNDQFGENIAKVEKVDDLTVKFILKEPAITFIPTLGMDFASVVSKEYADKLQADKTPELFNQKPIGTGPFIFVDYQTDAAIRYKANPDYWGGKQKIDDLVFAITTDPAVRAQKLKAGECNIMSYPAPADIAGLQADPNLKVEEQEGLNV
ncbi:ABC transporter substrate-binding protein, partial [Mesorhizobium sp. M7A.F.Ca.CA.004.05.2.1]